MCACVRPFDRGKARLVSKRQSMDKPARWIAFRKLPNRRRIVFSDGRIPASVHLLAVGSEPCSATNSRRAATYSWIRVLATSDSGTASPSNTPGGCALWELKSTTTTSGIHQAPVWGVPSGASFDAACCTVSDVITDRVTIRIGYCPFLDAMNTAHPAQSCSMGMHRERLNPNATVSVSAREDVEQDRGGG